MAHGKQSHKIVPTLFEIFAMNFNAYISQIVSECSCNQMELYESFAFRLQFQSQIVSLCIHATMKMTDYNSFWLLNLDFNLEFTRQLS